MGWNPGDRLTHRFNPELGPGVVHEVAGRTLVVRFLGSGDVLRLAASSDALERFEPRAGSRVVVHSATEVQTAEMEAPEGPTVTVCDLLERGRVRLSDGQVVGLAELWPAPPETSLFERLASGDVDPLEAFSLRLDALHLSRIREASGLGSFLGGRIRLFAHQLYVAERATRQDPARWLLADEVGLGKTVEACLVLNHLLRTRRAESALVVAPATLTVQWLGELWRKYHQVFVLVDEARLADVERDFGPGFNPFEIYRRAVIDLEFLAARPRLTEQAVAAGIDLLIVDEAHRPRRPPGHPGDAAWRAIAPIAGQGRHVLLLTATPFGQDTHGFMRLLQLLRPEEFPESESLLERLERLEHGGVGAQLPACTSATQRADIGGLPPRVAAPVDLSGAGWTVASRLVGAMRALPASDPVVHKATLAKLRRALESGAALDELLDPQDKPTRALCREADAADPRLQWLAGQAEGWKLRGDKTLVFVAHRPTLEWLRAELGRVPLRTGVFHEDLSPGQRDIEVAQFRLASGPSLLVSTECGGEGRNFEFCTRLVLFDLPWSPVAVEQRIGRLDRIGRTIPVEIVYFHRPGGELGAAIVELYEALGVFRAPLGGTEQALSSIEFALEDLALGGLELSGKAALEAALREANQSRERLEQAARRQLHREPYRREMAASILARIPPDLEELTRDVVLAACDELALNVEEHQGGARHSIELGVAARVATLPGVPSGASFLGSFDREEALRDESIDFFSSGHPLVEGLLAHLEEDPAGRVALLHITGTGQTGSGLLGLYKVGRGFEMVALDAEGRERPAWAERLTRRPLRSRRVSAEVWTADPEWAQRIRALAERLAAYGAPVAAAAFRME
jgi:ATP-dependent helicase HepA